MRNYFFKKSVRIFCAIVLGGLSIAVARVYFFGLPDYLAMDLTDKANPAQASYFDFDTAPGGDNVSGWAWSENIGWISFNDIDCDVNHNGTYQGTDEGAPDQCPSSGTVIHYGVKIAFDTGDFSGYAWSENVGWIKFGPFDSSETSSLSPNHGASYDYHEGDENQPRKHVLGWARICALTDTPDSCTGGDKGWLKMSGITSGGEAFGVTMSMTDDSSRGYAWNAEDDGSGIGWISFSSENCTHYNNAGNEYYDGNPSGCPAAGTPYIAYGVKAIVNHPPDNATADPDALDDGRACNGTVLQAFPSWSFYDVNQGSSQGGYHIIIDNNSDFSSPLFNSGECFAQDVTSCLANPSSNEFPASSITPVMAQIDYGERFYWRIRVFDEYHKPADDFTEASFVIADHEAPDPYFTWFIENPSQDEEVMFSSFSTCYSSDFSSGYLCPNSGVGYQWSFVNSCLVLPLSSPFRCSASDLGTIEQETSSSTIMTFDHPGPDTGAKLDVFDGYQCGSSTISNQINVKNKLPTWVESK